MTISPLAALIVKARRERTPLPLDPALAPATLREALDVQAQVAQALGCRIVAIDDVADRPLMADLIVRARAAGRRCCSFRATAARRGASRWTTASSSTSPTASTTPTVA